MIHRNVNYLLILLFTGLLSGHTAWAQQQYIFDEEFENNDNEWTLRDDEAAFSRIHKGKYLLQHKRSSGSWLFWTDGIVLRPDYDFEIETRLTQVAGAPDHPYGFVWGGKDAGNFYGFNIDAKGRFRVYKYQDDSYHELKHFTPSEGLVNPIGKANLLNIRKKGDLLSFYVNGVYVFSTDALPFFGSRAGYVLYKDLKLVVYELQVRQIPTLPVIFEEQFTQGKEEWRRGGPIKATGEIVNAEYQLKGGGKSSWSVAYRRTPLNADKDFVIESHIRRLQGREDTEYGLVWGGLGSENVYAFMINSYGAFRLLRREKGVALPIRDWTPPEHPIVHSSGRSNKLSVRKTDQTLSFFLNDIWLCDTPVQPFFGTQVGLVVTDTLAIACEDLLLYQGTPQLAGEPPKIEYWAPMQIASHSSSPVFTVKAGISTSSELAEATLFLNDKEVATMESATAQSGYAVWFEQQLSLQPGENTLKIVARNTDGSIQEKARKLVLDPNLSVTAPQADPVQTPVEKRTDHALFFAIDQYQEWGDLTNPIHDARTLAKELRDFYGFEVEIVENPTRAEVLRKLKEYARMDFPGNDQLLVFFAGHGKFDPDFGEGYVVCADSRKDDEGNDSYISHSSLRTIINNIPCRHNFLAMDVCFGGTIDPFIASSSHRGEDMAYKEINETEFIKRKMKFKTRRYLTSGGKEYVPDGRPGQHSPFTRKFLEALRNYGGHDKIITLPELLLYFERLLPEPRFGEFGSNEPGSDFLFIAN